MCLKKELRGSLSIVCVVIMLLVILSPEMVIGEEELMRFAQKEDVIGLWEMIPVPAEFNRVNPWPMPYQWFGFYENGRFSSMMTTESYTLQKQELEEIFAQRKLEVEYRLEGDWFILTYQSLPGHQEYWGINLVLKEATLASSIHILPGDLLMTLEGDEGIVYYRHLRRVR
ncbi:MAG: hypothetical protein A2Z88_09540 [Omnitrophica WOR_2 bacterium GWA2_47_8]|nr:MAG: hypothetical protein A2Z88_09540 [Omnitrophica WOR_2 bacterium GWA2_47_8]